MTCQFRDEPPQESPCFCTATFKARVRRHDGAGGGFSLELSVCEHHAGVLRDQGAETWPLDGE